MSGNWRKRLGGEVRAFPWPQALLRMGADFVSVNASVLLAFLLWFFVQAVVLQKAPPENIANSFRHYIRLYWLFWSGVALLVFHLNGFYTRTRGYAGRYKIWIIFRAVSLFLVTFVFADYFIVRGALVPRGVLVLAWVFALLSVGGTRMAKDFVLRNYRVQPRRRPAKIERVLVVGGAGYLGSCLVPLLLQRGYKVRVLDNLLFGDSALQRVAAHPEFELIRGDVRDIQAVVEATRDCDAVIHLAAIVGDPACDENQALAVDINRAATRMLLDVSRGYGVSRFLFASTCSVYGASDVLMDEHSTPVPISTYAQTKVESEKLLFEAASPEFATTVLRLGTLFGLSPRPRFDLVVNLLTARAAKLGKITIYNGEQWRPFLHVRDAARAFAVALEANADIVNGEIFNVGDFELNYRLSEVSEKIAALVPTVEVQNVENGDRRNYRVAFDKIHTRLGFRCEYTLDQGIREIYQAVSSDSIPDFTYAAFNNQAATRAFAQSPEAEQVFFRQWQALVLGEYRSTTSTQ